MKNKIPAQIMVIVLVLMAILSIIALSVTLTSIRDKEEKTQNSQYQSYYAVGENKLLDFQQLIGRDKIDTIANSDGTISLTGDTSEDSLAGTCDDVTADPTNTTMVMNCTFDNIDSSNYNPDKQESLKTILTITDSSKITNFPAQKDKDILLDLQTVSSDARLILSWSGSTTAWNFTLDKTDYTSEKTIYSPNSSIFANTVTSYPPAAGQCLNYSSVTNSGVTTVTINVTCANKMFFRLRPIMKAGTSTNINLEVVNNTFPLQRTLTNTTTTTDSGSSDNPVVVLETTYLLVAEPLSLFDYVLRTESDLIKN